MKNTHNKNLHGFWSGPFSQWAQSDFKLCGFSFNTAEQAMMLGKAALFHDVHHAQLIMDSISPNDQKGYGRKVKGFDQPKWEDICIELVTAISYAKFTQDAKYFTAMEATGNDWIVEASPYDKVWGIGMKVDHPDFKDPSKWQGTNYLGECVMNAREIIFNPNLQNIKNLAVAVNTVEKIYDNVRGQIT